jgi:secreted trypsin-like serine protease
MRSALPCSVLLLLRCLARVECDTADVLRQAQEVLTSIPDNATNIVGGQAAQVGEFPWYAVYSGGGPLCGGALVHKDIVVTAAHCLENDKPGSVRVGATTTSNGNLATVESVVIHPNYRSADLENDIAILKLASPLNNEVAVYNEDGTVPRDGSNTIAMGFGRTSPDSSSGSSILRKVTLTALSDDECGERLSSFDSTFNLCADKQNAGICFGDSGGPLVTEGDVVVGLASFVVKTCASRFPDYFTRMSSYSNWLKRAICENSDDPPDEGCADAPDDDGPDDGGDDDDEGDGIFDSIVDCIGTVIDFFGGLLGGD